MPSGADPGQPGPRVSPPEQFWCETACEEGSQLAVLCRPWSRPTGLRRSPCSSPVPGRETRTSFLSFGLGLTPAWLCWRSHSYLPAAPAITGALWCNKAPRQHPASLLGTGRKGLMPRAHLQAKETLSCVFTSQPGVPVPDGCHAVAKFKVLLPTPLA